VESVPQEHVQAGQQQTQQANSEDAKLRPQVELDSDSLFNLLAAEFQPSMVKSGIQTDPKIVQGTQALTLLTQLVLK